MSDDTTAPDADVEATVGPAEQPADDDDVAEPDTATTLTVVKATNKEQFDILFGGYEARQPLTLPERVNGQTYLVKRLYDPVDTVEFDEEKTHEEIREWFSSEPDHEALEGVDWGYHEFRDVLQDAVTLRQDRDRIVSSVLQRLGQLPLESEEAISAVDEIRVTLNEIVATADPVRLDQVESPELEGDDA